MTSHAPAGEQQRALGIPGEVQTQTFKDYEAHNAECASTFLVMALALIAVILLICPFVKPKKRLR